MTTATRRPYTRRTSTVSADPALLYELLPLLAEGLTYQQMARRLGLSAEGVRSRMKRLLELLRARNGAQAVAIAYQRGLLKHDTQHAIRVRRELAERHASDCALLTPPRCNCRTDTEEPTSLE